MFAKCDNLLDKKEVRLREFYKRNIGSKCNPCDCWLRHTTNNSNRCHRVHGSGYRYLFRLKIFLILCKRFGYIEMRSILKKMSLFRKTIVNQPSILFRLHSIYSRILAFAAAHDKSTLIDKYIDQMTKLKTTRRFHHIFNYRAQIQINPILEIISYHAMEQYGMNFWYHKQFKCGNIYSVTLKSSWFFFTEFNQNGFKFYDSEKNH